MINGRDSKVMISNIMLLSGLMTAKMMATATISYGKIITDNPIVNRKQEPGSCSNYDNNIIKIFIYDMLLKDCIKGHSIY